MKSSVVIPALNSALTIERALESVLAQTMRPSEVIVVDDCSTDNTVEVLQAMQPAFETAGIELRVLTSPANAGGAVSRNRGLAAARECIIALMDSDDRWLPNHLEASIAQGQTQGCVVVSRARHILAGGKVRMLPNIPLNEGEHPLDYIFRRGGAIQTTSMVLFGTACRLRFDEKLRKHQDFDFIAAAYKAQLPIIQLWSASTEYHDYGGDARVSVRNSLPSSRYFYLKWRRDLSPAARHAFLARFLAQQLPPSKERLHRKLVRAAVLDGKIARPIRLRLVVRAIRSMVR